MQINRDYSRPFFTGSRQRRGIGRTLFLFLLLVAGIVLFVRVNFDRLQSMAMDAVGMAPTPTPFASEIATRATDLALAGDLEGAAALFAQAVRQQPENLNYLYEYGRLLIDLGDYTRALEIAEQCIDLDIVDPRGYALKATALVFDDQAAAAIPVATSGLELAPDFASLHAALSRAYTDTGRYDVALDSGFRAVEIAPYNADARRAYAYALIWNGLVDEAITQLEQAVTADPTRMPAYFELAGLYLSVSRDQDAIDLYNVILSEQPRNARAHLRLCETYRKVGQFNQALGYCQDAVVYDPTYAEAHLQLGLIYYSTYVPERNNYMFAEALEAFTACVEHNPASLECTYRMGLSHFYLGDCDTAWPILRDALLMARSRTGPQITAAVENISTGLVAIGETCPQYRGLAPSLLDDEGTGSADDTGATGEDG